MLANMIILNISFWDLALIFLLLNQKYLLTLKFKILPAFLEYDQLIDLYTLALCDWIQTITN